MNTITFCNECKSANDAAKSGHIECLQYLHENDCPWDKEACARAAEYGHLECLQYLHENGCPWDTEVCDRAAENGQLWCLEYLYKNGCPWDKWTCYHIEANGELDCLEYHLHENGCTENTEDEEYGNSNTQCGFPTTRVQIDRTEYVSDLSMNDTKVFETLDPDEKKYLPLNYIVSSLMEWKFVQEACASGFRSVANLSRVSNKTIREIANISQHTLDKKTAMIPKLNQAFIDYAAQRGI